MVMIKLLAERSRGDPLTGIGIWGIAGNHEH